MSLQAQLKEDLKTAMRAKDKVRLGTIRLLMTALKNAEIEKKGKGLSEADELSIVARQAKQRRESADSYQSADRPELAEKELAELAIIEGYLPEQLTPEKVSEMIREVIAEVGATEKKDFGKVMKAIMPKLKGRFPGKEVRPLIDAELS